MTDNTQDDLVQAAVAAKLREAADLAASGFHPRNILALITEDAQAALDRVVAAERERCAKIVEDHSEYVWSRDSSRHLGKRIDGDRMGLAYAAAIRKGGE